MLRNTCIWGWKGSMLMSMSETTGGSGTHPVRKCDSLVELLCSLRRRSDAHQEPLYRFLQITVSEFWAFSLRAHFATYDLRTSLLSEIVLSQRIGLHASSPATSQRFTSLWVVKEPRVERPLSQIQFLSLLEYKFLLGVVGGKRHEMGIIQALKRY